MHVRFKSGESSQIALLAGTMTYKRLYCAYGTHSDTTATNSANSPHDLFSLALQSRFIRLRGVQYSEIIDISFKFIFRLDVNEGI